MRQIRCIRYKPRKVRGHPLTYEGIVLMWDCKPFYIYDHEGD